MWGGEGRQPHFWAPTSPGIEFHPHPHPPPPEAPGGTNHSQCNGPECDKFSSPYGELFPNNSSLSAVSSRRPKPPSMSCFSITSLREPAPNTSRSLAALGEVWKDPSLSLFKPQGHSAQRGCFPGSCPQQEQRGAPRPPREQLSFLPGPLFSARVPANGWEILSSFSFIPARLLGVLVPCGRCNE